MKSLLFIILFFAFHTVMIGQNIFVVNKNENHHDGKELLLLSPTGKIIKVLKGIEIFENTNTSNDYCSRKSTDGLICALNSTTDKLGYLSLETGEWAIQPQFDNTPYYHDFFDGLAIVDKRDDVGNNKSSVINKTGNVILPFCDWTIDDYSDGLAIVHKEGNQFGAIDRTGKLVIPFSVGKLSDFKDGLAVKNNYTAFVDKNSEQTGLFGFMDKTGKMIIPQEWSWAEPFSDGLAAVKNKEGKYGFIDKSGKIAIDCSFLAVNDFSEGIATVYLEPKKDGFSEMTFIDKTGYQATRKKYAIAQNFKNGLAAVAKIDNSENEDKATEFGFVDKNFNLVIPFQMDITASAAFKKYFWFSDGLCPTSKGFINKKGKLVIPFTPFTIVKIAPFENNRAKVFLYNPKTYKYYYRLIDKMGKKIWQSVPNTIQ